MHAHGGHAWMRMGLRHHGWGLGHGKEARSATDGHCGSWVPRPNGQKTTNTRDLARRGKGGKSSHACTQGHVMGDQGPTKTDKKRRKQKSKRKGKRESRQHAQTYLRKHKMQCTIYAKKNAKTSKNNASKTHNSEPTLSSGKNKKHTKEGNQKTRKNSKRVQRKPKQQKKQRKQKHYLCSQKRYRRQKNTVKTSIHRKKCLQTGNSLQTHRKSPKGRQNGKTTQ